jgi:hypothetical protein
MPHAPFLPPHPPFISSPHRLAAFKRRAALSSWLREQARPTLELTLKAAGEAGVGSGDAAAAKLLTLLSGHQLAAAVGVAVAAGDVRLATLIAQVHVQGGERGGVQVC